MKTVRWANTATGQASVLFVAAGSLGLVGELVPDASHVGGLRAVNLVAVVLGVAIARLPWSRWPQPAALALVPAAFALIVAGRWYDAQGVGALYALWFAVVFCWVGSWHPVRTAVWLAPVGALAYAIPFLPGSPAASPEALASVFIAIPIGVVLAEILAAQAVTTRDAQRALEASSALLERANLTDDLTGLGNRRRANALLDALEVGDTLVLMDLDHFKAVNDTRGHAAGDQVLMDLGAYLLGAVREADCVARFGGEEFLILLRGAHGDPAGIVERLLSGWRTTGCGVTLSAGAAVHEAHRGPSTTLKVADAMLYRAKSAGRDRLVMGDGSAREATVAPGAGLSA